MKAAISTIGALLVSILILPANASTGLYTAAVNADNPVLYYGLDETSGTTAVDSAPAGGVTNGTYTGTYTLGQPGALTGANSSTAVAFSPTPTKGYIDSTFVLTPTSAFTVEFWVNFASLNTGDDQTILSQRNGSGFGKDVVYWNNSTQTISSAVGSSVVSLTTNPGTLVVGQYTLVDFVYDGAGGYAWYANGAADGSGSLGTVLASDGAVVIGIHKDLTLAPLDGTLDEFAIYTTALTSTQVAAHFTAASAPEPSSLALLGVGAAMLMRRKAAHK